MSRMKETDVKDKRGNVVISKGLKVRHTKSQYEYTVDSVVKEPSGQVTIMLASPEAPRFDTKQTRHNGVLTGQRGDKVLYEAEPMDDMSAMFYIPDDEEESSDDLLAVPADEFEREYEVK